MWCGPDTAMSSREPGNSTSRDRRRRSPPGGCSSSRSCSLRMNRGRRGGRVLATVQVRLVIVRCDALVIGGGPAGSTCARSLRLAGWNVVVIDRARFPRDKVCAGWLTPGVFSLLDLDPADYRASGRTLEEITAFRTSVIGGPPIETAYPHAVSYSARRCEFDEFLLRRSGATVVEDTAVHAVRREGDMWRVDDRFEAPVLI